MTRYKTYTRLPHEMLAEISGADEASRPAVFREYISKPALLTILDLAFNNFTWLIDADKIKYDPADEHRSPTTLNSMSILRSLGNFVRECYPADAVFDAASSKRLYRSIVNILEGIHPKDAELLLAIISGRFGEAYPHITRELVQSVVPGVLRT